MRKTDCHNVKERVLEVLGTKATDWLKKPNRALAGAAPSQLIKRKSGRKRILRILGRIEHSVYS